MPCHSKPKPSKSYEAKAQAMSKKELAKDMKADRKVMKQKQSRGR